MSPLRHPRPGDAPWVHPRGRWALAGHRILVLDGQRRRHLARRWGDAWPGRLASRLDGWLLLVPDQSSPHQCRVEALHPASSEAPQRSFVVIRLGHDQLRVRSIGFGRLQEETAAIETLILRLQAAVCPGLPVVVEGLFDEASQEWFAGLARRHADWWLSWRPGLPPGHIPRVIPDSPPPDTTPLPPGRDRPASLPTWPRRAR